MRMTLKSITTTNGYFSTARAQKSQGITEIKMSAASQRIWNLLYSKGLYLCLFKVVHIPETQINIVC